MVTVHLSSLESYIELLELLTVGFDDDAWCTPLYVGGVVQQCGTGRDWLGEWEAE